jgi:hypothetical protein
MKLLDTHYARCAFYTGNGREWGILAGAEASEDMHKGIKAHEPD